MDQRILTPEEFEKQLLDGPPGSMTLLLHNYRALTEKVERLEQHIRIAKSRLEQALEGL